MRPHFQAQEYISSGQMFGHKASAPETLVASTVGTRSSSLDHYIPLSQFLWQTQPWEHIRHVGV
jgi:hypothetical protein